MSSKIMIQEDNMFKAIDAKEKSILYYPKKEANWKEISDFLEETYKERYWTWRGFGIGTDEAVVCVCKRRNMCDYEITDYESDD